MCIVVVANTILYLATATQLLRKTDTYLYGDLWIASSQPSASASASGRPVPIRAMYYII